MSSNFKQQVAASALAMAALSMIPAPSSAEQNTISDDKLLSAIRAANVVKPGLPLRVAVDGSKVIVQTQRTKKQNDNDCKIDAAFIAKSVLDCKAQGVDRVNVLFSHDTDEKFDKVAVTSDDVTRFGNGSISEQDLLKRVSISPVQPAQIRSLAPHADAEPYAARKLMLVDRIEALRQKGANVTAFEKLFSDMESLHSQSKNDEADQTINRLANAIKDQQDLAKQAKRVQMLTPTARNGSNFTQASTGSRQSFNAPNSQASNSPALETDLRELQSMRTRLPSEKHACFDNYFRELQAIMKTDPERAKWKVRDFRGYVERQLNCK